jgi:hypothetical protein
MQVRTLPLLAAGAIGPCLTMTTNNTHNESILQLLQLPVCILQVPIGEQLLHHTQLLSSLACACSQLANKSASVQNQMHGWRWYQQCMEKAAWCTSIASVF